MRITSSMVMKNYEKSLNHNMGNLTSSLSKITGKKFANASDDPISAMRALKATHEVDNNAQYQENEGYISTWMDTTESTVKTVDSILQSASETVTKAKNGTDTTQAGSYATAISNYQNEILQALNKSSGDQYIFGGSTSDPAPFKVGTAADEAAVPGSTGKLMYYNQNTSQYMLVSSITSSDLSSLKRSMPVDLGLGMSVDSSGKVVSNTAFDASTSALDFICQNVTSSGCTNIYDDLSTAVTQLNNGDNTKLDSTLTSIKNTQDSELKTTVGIGEKSKMLTFLSDKMTSDNETLTEKQTNVEYEDSVLAITNFLMSQMVYQASLSVGSSILQPSLVNFLK